MDKRVKMFNTTISEKKKNPQKMRYYCHLLDQQRCEK